MNAKHPLAPFALLALVTFAPACELEGYENILVPDGGFQSASLSEDMDADELLAPSSALADEAESQGRRGYVEFGAFPDDDLGSRQLEIEKGGQVFFDRHAARAQEYRSLDAKVLAAIRAEQGTVHTARPGAKFLETASREIVRE